MEGRVRRAVEDDRKRTHRAGEDVGSGGADAEASRRGSCRRRAEPTGRRQRQQATEARERHGDEGRPGQHEGDCTALLLYMRRRAEQRAGGRAAEDADGGGNSSAGVGRGCEDRKRTKPRAGATFGFGGNSQKHNFSEEN